MKLFFCCKKKKRKKKREKSFLVKFFLGQMILLNLFPGEKLFNKNRFWTVTTVTTVTNLTTLTTDIEVGICRFKIPFDALKVTFSQIPQTNKPTNQQTDN